MRALLLVLVVAGSLPVHAEPRIRGVRSVDLPRPGAERTEPPRLVLSIGAPAGLGPADFQLMSTEDEAQTFGASKVVPFQDSDEMMAMIVLVDGKVRFLGDPEPDPVGAEPAAPIPGLWEEVRGSLDVLSRVRARRTRVAVWVYGEGAPAERLALGEPALVNGDALGGRKEHAATRTGGLRRALEAAQGRLATEEGRRVIVVIGDGTDTLDEVSYRDVENELGAASIEVYALVGSPRALDARAVAKLARLTRATGGALFRAAEPAELPAQAERLLAAVESVYTVVFPGARADDGAKLPFDGTEHELTVRVKQEEVGVTVRLPRWDWPPVAPPDPGVRWWLWLLLGGIVLVAGVVVGVVLLRRVPDASRR